MKKLNPDFIDRLKKVFIESGYNQIIFDLDVFDDMSEDEYLVFKTIFNRYNDRLRSSDEETID